jgi:hypothetical protein
MRGGDPGTTFGDIATTRRPEPSKNDLAADMIICRVNVVADP